MAESVLLGAAIGGGGAMLTGNDPLKGAAIGGAMGGASAGFGGAGVSSGAEAAASNMPSHLTSSVGASSAGATANAGARFANPALTNGMGQSSNPFTQFGRDAYQNVGQHVDKAFNNVTDTIGSGFDWVNDKTGMENKDWTQMAMTQGINSMQPTPEAPIQHAPMGSGISRPNVDLSKTAGSLLSSNPLLQEELRKRQGLL